MISSVWYECLVIIILYTPIIRIFETILYPEQVFQLQYFSKQIPDPRGVEGRIILPAWITPTWNSHLKRKKNCIDYLKDLYPFEVSPYMIDEICFSFAVLQMYSL